MMLHICTSNALLYDVLSRLPLLLQRNSLSVVQPLVVSLSTVSLCPHSTHGSHARAVKFIVYVTFAQASSLSQDNVPFY